MSKAVEALRRASYKLWGNNKAGLSNNDFNPEKLPEKVGGRITYYKALEINRTSLERIWNRQKNKLTEKEKQDYQIVVINPPGLKDPRRIRDDVTIPLFQDLSENQIGPHPVATITETNYSGNDPDSRVVINNREKASRIYIVTSLVTGEDFRRVNKVVSDYRRTFGKDNLKEVVVIATHFPSREDKNGKIDSATGAVRNTGQVMAIDADLATLEGNVDRIFNLESHSSALAALAADHGIPLLSLSPFKPLLEALDKKSFFQILSKIFVGPDEGRNIIADRIAKILKIDRVDLEKNRDSDTQETESLEIPNKLLKKLKGKDAFLYDDEGATLGTMKHHIIDKLIPSGVKSITILLVHGKFTNGYFDKNEDWHPGWEENLNEILTLCECNNVKFQMFVTNSREPVGDLELYIQKHKNVIQIVNIKDYIKDILLGDITNVDFFKDRADEIIMS